MGLGRSQENCSCSRTADWPTFPFDRSWKLLRVSAPRVPLPCAMGMDSRPPCRSCSDIFSTPRAMEKPAMTRWSTPPTGPRAISSLTPKPSCPPTSRSRPASPSWSRPLNRRPRRRAQSNRGTNRRPNPRPSPSRGLKHAPSAWIMLKRRGRWKHHSRDGVLDVVGLSPELIDGLYELTVSRPMYTELYAAWVDMKALLKFLSDRKLSGSVMIRSAGGTGVIILSDGDLAGAYTSESRDISDKPDRAPALCDDPASMIDVQSPANTN